MKIECNSRCKSYHNVYRNNKGIIKIDGFDLVLSDYGFTFCSICRFHTILESNRCKCCKVKMRIKRQLYRKSIQNKILKMGYDQDDIYLTIDQKEYLANLVS